MGRKQGRIHGVIDIETGRDGRVLAIGLAYRENGRTIYQQLDHWGELLRQIEQRKISRIYAHNGGGFDYLSMLQYLPDSWRIDGSVVNGKLIAITLKRDNYQCRFVDSFRIAPVSLNALATSLLGHGKTEDASEFHPEDMLLSEPQRFADYLRSDCELLLGCVEKMTEVYRQISPKFSSLGITCGSTAMKLWDSMEHPRYQRPGNQKLNQICKLAYTGGRCECFRPGDYQCVTSYDVNSMYPYAMLKASVPVSGRTVLTNVFRGNPGVWLIDFHQPRGNVPLFMVNGNGEFSGRGWYYSPEISAALEFGIEVKILAGFEFLDYTDSLFRDFINPLWDLRVKYGSQSAFGLVAKLSMNNLYGKMGQGDLIESIFTAVDSDAILSRNASVLDLSRDLYSGVEGKICEHQHYGIAGTITSFSRAYLFRLMVENNPIYCDTDSIHTLDKMTDNAGLGGLKIEKRANRAVYVGKKMYGMLTNSGQIVKIKGVRTGTKEMQWQVSIPQMATLLKGQSIPATFQSFPTMREVLADGMQSCKLITRKRTVRMLERERAKLYR